MTLLDGFEILLLIAAFTVLGFAAVVVLESWAALALRSTRGPASEEDRQPTFAVLVPAHDEQDGIGSTLGRLRLQIGPSDRLVVVADNCSDATATIALAAGAEVVERSDPTRRGKGYALDFGMKYLASRPPEVVVLMDADCVATDGAIDRLVRAAVANDGPVQAVYLMREAPDGGVRSRLSAFAFRVKNLVRPLGLHRLGFPCLITGTGIACTWDVFRTLRLASGNLVEDMQMGIDLALAGRPPSLCPEALVEGQLPSGQKAATVQRTRWEQGHLHTLFSQVPRLAWAALRTRRLGLLALALELSVPPLALLVLAGLATTAAASALVVAGGSWLPLQVMSVGGFVAAVTGFAVWVKFGRQTLPLWSLLAVPAYVFWKLPIYLKILIRPETSWRRTDRTAPPVDRPA